MTKLDDSIFQEVAIFAKDRATLFGMAGKDVPADGVVTGCARSDGRTLHLVSQDFTVPRGAAGEVHCAKMADLIELSLKTGSPFLFMNDSGGARVEHGMSNPALVAIYSSVLPTALKPGASSEGDETKLCRRALAGVVVRFTRKTRRSCSGGRLTSHSGCNEDGDLD